MGSGIGSIWHWLVVLLIVVLLFGTKKLRDIGTDLGSAIKSFRSSMKEGEEEAARDEAARAADPSKVANNPNQGEGGRVIEGQVTSREGPKV